jgi:hypothetical protein
MKAYWFSNNEKRLGYGDNRVVRLGRTHKHKGPLELGESGLHASLKPLDALRYALGHHLWVVELSGEILTGSDKLCASERTYLHHLNCEQLLREFARKQTLINIEKNRPYTNQSDQILRYLQTGDESIQSAAWLAAQSAAQSAAWLAAWLATQSAAQSAARPAAWSAAESVAWLAARSAAQSAAWSAAESAANEMLTQMVEAELKIKENL